MNAKFACLAISLSLIFSACDTATNPAPTDSTVKPNPTLSVEVGVDVPVTIAAGKSVSLTFVPKASATYEIRTIGNTDAYLELRDSSGNKTLEIDEYSTGLNGLITYTALTSSPVTIVVSGQTASTAGASIVTIKMTNGPDDYESDNKLSTAKLITTDGVVQSRTLGLGDTDWVKIPVDSGKSYKIAGSGTNTVYIKIVNADSTTLVAETSYSTTFTAPRTGFVYARLNYYYATSSYTGAYTVGVTAIASLTDAYESDNKLSTAKLITTDGVLQSRTLGLGDTDWVKIPVDSGKSYKVVGSGANTVYIKIVNADSTTLMAETSYYTTFTAPRTGFVYARLNYYYATSNYTGAYTVNVTAIASLTDAYESDNKLSTAKLITTDGVAQNRTLGVGDTDWVKIPVDSGKSYKVVGSGANTVYIKIVNADSTTLMAETSYYTTFTAPSTGFVYARLNYYYATSSYTGAYTVNVTTVASQTDAYESDNKLSTAKLITTDGVVQNRTLGVGDTDWVKIPVDSGKSYTVSGSGANTLYIKIYGADSLSLTSETSRSISFTAPKSGFVYARLNYYYATSSYNGAYTVSVTTATPIVDTYEPDDIRANATLLPVDGTVQSHSLQAGEHDWIKVDLIAGTTYTISIINSSPDWTYVTDLYTSVEATGYTQSITTSYSTSTNFTPSASGTHYLDFHGLTSSSSGPYTVSIETY